MTYSNVVATLCLFLLLGGAAYAAAKLPKDSVGAKQIKRSAVRSAEIKDSSLLADDFKAGQLPNASRAYGTVSGAGVLDPARSEGITVTKISSQQGAYCVRPTAGSAIDPTKVNPVVSGDLASGTGSVHLAQVSSFTYYSAECPSESGWEIYTQIQSGTNNFIAADSGFSILVP